MKVSATRMEFLKLKNRIKIAKRGHKLLKEKRDELMKNFLQLRKEAESKRAEAEEALNKALKSFALARLSARREEIDASLLFPSKTCSSKTKIKYVAGLEIPELEVSMEDKKTQNYSLANTPSELDSAITKAEEALLKIAAVANLEAGLYSLAAEIEKVRRRVNALEHIFIPRLESSAKYIEMRLYEMELENIINIMKIKELAKS